MSNIPEKILIVIPKLFHGGGAEHVAKEQAKLFRELGYEVSFFTFHAGESLPSEHSMRHSEWWFAKIYRMITLPGALARYCKKNKTTVVVSHTERANYVVLLSKLFFQQSLQVITVTHNHRYCSHWKHYLPIRLLYPYAHRSVTVSLAIAEVLQKKHSLVNVQTTYNPFDFKRIEHLSRENVDKQDDVFVSTNKKTFIAVGRLHEQKGYRYLLKAFALYVKKHPDSQLLVLGEGPLRQQLQDQIRELALESSVHLLGNKANVFPYLRRSDCFLLSSLWEGLPTVLIEAMAVGLPIISTNCKSGPEEILPPTHQFVDVHGDIVAQLAVAMEQAVIGDRVSYDMRRFSQDEIKQQWNDLLQGTVGK